MTYGTRAVSRSLVLVWERHSKLQHGRKHSKGYVTQERGSWEGLRPLPSRLLEVLGLPTKLTSASIPFSKPFLLKTFLGFVCLLHLDITTKVASRL